MDEALIQDAEDDVDRDERGKNEQRHVGERVSEGCSRALEIGLHAGGHVQVFLHFGDGGDRAAEGRVGSEVERDRDGWELPLMIDGKLLRFHFEMRERAERHGVAFSRTRGARGVGAFAGSCVRRARRERVDGRIQSVRGRCVEGRSR
jgi:hypothetical protein